MKLVVAITLLAVMGPMWSLGVKLERHQEEMRHDSDNADDSDGSDEALLEISSREVRLQG